MKYAGIGSRETPQNILLLMQQIGLKLLSKDYILRSGGAPGADSAFETYIPKDKKEIYLPWKNFNNNPSELYTISQEAIDLVYMYHPCARNLSSGAMKLMARNGYQVLGKDLKTPSKFIVCWTKDGEASGGTGQALRIAVDYKIPVFNLYKKNAIDLLNEYLED